MIISKQRYKTVPNGKTSWRGLINLDKQTADQLGLDPRDVLLVLLDYEDMDLPKEEFMEKIGLHYEKFKKWLGLMKELEELKGDL